MLLLRLAVRFQNFWILVIVLNAFSFATATAQQSVTTTKPNQVSYR